MHHACMRNVRVLPAVERSGSIWCTTVSEPTVYVRMSAIFPCHRLSPKIHHGARSVREQCSSGWCAGDNDEATLPRAQGAPDTDARDTTAQGARCLMNVLAVYWATPPRSSQYIEPQSRSTQRFLSTMSTQLPVTNITSGFQSCLSLNR